MIDETKISKQPLPAPTARVGWLFWVKRNFKTVFQSISAVCQREGERGEQE